MRIVSGSEGYTRRASAIRGARRAHPDLGLAECVARGTWRTI